MVSGYISHRISGFANHCNIYQNGQYCRFCGLLWLVPVIVLVSLVERCIPSVSSIPHNVQQCIENLSKYVRPCVYEAKNNGQGRNSQQEERAISTREENEEPAV